MVKLTWNQRNPEKARESVRKFYAKPENQEKHRIAGRLRLEDPEIRARANAQKKTYRDRPEIKKKQVEYLKEYFSDEEKREHRRKYQKDWRLKNREAQLVKKKAYRMAHPEKDRAYDKKYRETFPEKYKAKQLRWQNKNPEKVVQFATVYRQKRRYEVMSKLCGGTPYCQGLCGCNHISLLEINHLQRTWGKGKRPNSEKGTPLYNRILKMPHPKRTYNVLCINCNRQGFNTKKEQVTKLGHWQTAKWIENKKGA